jgi:hypothetical protein
VIRRALVVVAVLVIGACGGGEKEVTLAPVPVDPALAPASIEAGGLNLFENTDDTTRDAFANAGSSSLMADGRLWEIRRAERLVGTLQITTVLPQVDLNEESRRQGIVRDILAGAVTRIRIDDVEVAMVSLQDRAQYVWFGQATVEILTVKGNDEVDPEDVLREILDHQRSQVAWVPLADDLSSDRSR